MSLVGFRAQNHPQQAARDDVDDHAACTDADPELFYATTETSIQNAARITQAKTYCDLCPVRAQCLLFALDHDDQWGIYGGMTVEERNKLRKVAT